MWLLLFPSVRLFTLLFSGSLLHHPFCQLVADSLISYFKNIHIYAGLNFVPVALSASAGHLLCLRRRRIPRPQSSHSMRLAGILFHQSVSLSPFFSDSLFASLSLPTYAHIRQLSTTLSLLILCLHLVTTLVPLSLISEFLDWGFHTHTECSVFSLLLNHCELGA